MHFNISSVVKKASSITAMVAIVNVAQAQIVIPETQPNFLLQHGIEQYQQGHYNLAHKTLSEYLALYRLPGGNKAALITDANRDQAAYYQILSAIKMRHNAAVVDAQYFIENTPNTAFKQRVAYELAKSFFTEGKYDAAIKYYELAGVDNLTNEEIADAKFEMAYAYFLQQNFDKARNFLAGIKELPDNKYYLASNYYYGLLSYNEGDYDQALKSFERVRDDAKYKDIVPYYESEIYYFKGDYDKVLSNAKRYLDGDTKLFYDKEMRLLTAQTLFELKQYSQALPYFEYYYNNSDRVSKEVLYQHAYTYYSLGRYNQAIEKFQQLSNNQDTLGQTAMYLLGDAYLKNKDKKGARNAFALSSEMDFNPVQKEASSFLYNKLSYDLGFESIATRGFDNFIKSYPNSKFIVESKSLLSSLLVKNSNYAEAYDILSTVAVKDAATKKIFQQAAVGRGLQLMQNKDYEMADGVFTQSLQDAVDPALEAVAYFWKGEAAYKMNKFEEAAQYTKAFLVKVKGNETATANISSKATVQNANINLGYTGLKSNNFSEAQSAFAAVQQNSGNASVASDAIIRQADAAFMQKDFNEALRLYDKAIASNAGEPDYARFQKALILGLQDKDAEKIELLKSIVSKNTAIKHDAMLELASAYIDADKNKEAIALLETLNSATGVNPTIKSKAAYQLAYAYQDNKQNEKAIAAYKDFLAKYPAAAERNTALGALKTLYISQGRPEQYAAFLQSQNIQDNGNNDIEEAFYDAADNEFSANKFDKAVVQFSKYLEKYPNGNYAAKALYYRAESYAALKQNATALKDYDALLKQGWNAFSEDAAIKAANISLGNKNYSEAKKYYALLHANNATNSVNAANTGLMKIAFAEQDYQATAQYADALINNETDARNKATAQLYKAKSLQMRNQSEEAKSLYQSLDKANIGAISAEARYRIAEMLFAQKQNDAAEKAASYAAQSSAGEDYWVVKNYMLLADILTDNKDYFNAKATLQSIISNASDKELVAEAKTKLANVKALEKNKSKLAD